MKSMALLILSLAARLALASADVGQLAPDFSLKGHDGRTYKLSDMTKEKKIVVLEWFNDGCPYVHKHYDSGNMQRLQSEMKAQKDVAWFTIASSAKGKQGYLATQKEAAKIRSEKKMDNTALLLDTGSLTAKAYEAKTTPHMFVIDKKGLVAYNGAIDSSDTARPINLDAYIKDASIHKYVEEAVASLEAERKVETASTEPYGCSLKY